MVSSPHCLVSPSCLIALPSSPTIWLRRTRSLKWNKEVGQHHHKLSKSRAYLHHIPKVFYVSHNRGSLWCSCSLLAVPLVPASGHEPLHKYVNFYDSQATAIFSVHIASVMHATWLFSWTKMCLNHCQRIHNRPKSCSVSLWSDRRCRYPRSPLAVPSPSFCPYSALSLN